MQTHDLLWHTLNVIGLNNPSGRWYSFWSGFGSDLAYLSVGVVAYRKLQCHADGCRRLGLHHVAGTMFVTCRKHHPHGGNSVERIKNSV